MKYKFFNRPPIFFGYTLALLLFFISTHLMIRNLKNDLNAKFLFFNFMFWQNFANREKVVWPNKTNPTFLDFGGKNVPKAF